MYFLVVFCKQRTLVATEEIFLSGSDKEHLIKLVHLFHSGSQVLDKELPQVVQGLQLLGLEWKKKSNQNKIKKLD